MLPCERTLRFKPCFESGPTFHAPCLDVKVILVVDVAPRLYVLLGKIPACRVSETFGR